MLARNRRRVASRRQAILALAVLLVIGRLPAAAGAAEIISVEPAVVPTAGGTRVTFTGRGFTPGLTLRVGGIPLAGQEFVDAEHMRGSTPTLPAGFHTADVVDPFGGGARLPDAVEAVINLREAALGRLAAASSAGLEYEFERGFPRFIRARVPVAGAGAVERARAFLKKFQDLYSSSSPDLALGVRRVSAEQPESVQFYQTLRGMSVVGGELVVLLDGEAVVGTVGKLVMPPERIDTTPALGVDAAEAAARRLHVSRAARVNGESRLVILDRGHLLGTDPDPRLAWRVTLGQRQTWRHFIDARTGEGLLSFPLKQESGSSFHGLDLDMQDAEDEASAGDDNCFWGSDDVDIATESTFNNAYTGDVDATAAYDYIKAAYAFYHNRFNRHSYDDDYSQIELFLHAVEPGNAAWVYGCDLIQVATGQVSFETLVHELTHAVVADTSGLVYAFYSGALNEHYADVMAVIADRERSAAQASPIDWTYAEQKTNGGGPVRDFSDPSRFGQAETTNDLSWGTPDGDGKYPDNGRVHFNSGIPNKAAFLMVEGFDEALSLTQLRSLKWYALTHVGENASFVDARNLEVATAVQWAASGTNGFGAEQVCAVRNAWASVGVGKWDFECDGIEDLASPDTDGDGVPDIRDNCPLNPNPDQANSDPDPFGDACDGDRDGDGFSDGVDTCPDRYNPPQGPCDDYDNDGRKDWSDNCPYDFNPAQQDADADGEGDACEVDPDHDGVDALADNCSHTPNADQANADGDCYGDACDRCPNTPESQCAYRFDGSPFQPDSDGDGVPDACDFVVFTNGLPGGPIDADAGATDLEVQGSPGRWLQIPLLVCTEDCPDGFAPAHRVEALLSALDENTRAWISDDEGRVLSRSPRLAVDGRLRFRPRGGASYFLNFSFGPLFASEGPTSCVLKFEQGENVPPVVAFRRGDSNGDGGVDLSDAVHTFSFLFLGAETPACRDASDANDDRALDISDGIFTLQFLFSGGEAIPDPGAQGCSPDPSGSLGCEVYSRC